MVEEKKQKLPTKADFREERRQANIKDRLAFQHPYHVDGEGKPRKVSGCPKCERSVNK